MGNKIILFGANGFIGKFLSDSFGKSVLPITRKECDLLDKEQVERFLRKETPDVVINCAASVELDLNKFLSKPYFENINIFYNLFSNRKYFGRFINFGSGAEFDRKTSIDNKLEEDIRIIKPSDHYGLSKNHISNVCLETENFYTIRLFGCLHKSNKNRLFDKLIKNDSITLENKYFDYFNLEDLTQVVDYFSDTNIMPKYKDINLVYREKLLISDMVDKFICVHGLKTKISYDKGKNNYTGSSTKIDSLGFDFKGIEQGIMDYMI